MENMSPAIVKYSNYTQKRMRGGDAAFCQISLDT